MGEPFQRDPHLELQANKATVAELRARIAAEFATQDEATKRIITDRIIADLDRMLGKPEPFTPALELGYGGER